MVCKTLDKDTNCDSNDCTELAISLWYDQQGGRVLALCIYCLEHAKDMSRAEYFTSCPNCGCGVEVN